MGRTATGDGYVYLDCPDCGQTVAEPFSIWRGPDAFAHGHGRSHCRVWFWPKPDGNHEAGHIPDNRSMETQIRILHKRARALGWRPELAYSYLPLATAA